ncbi:MAG: hypothetical protein ACKOAH_15045, partial [Pirellula sp.]
ELKTNDTLERTLAEFRLSIAEYVMLHLIHYESRPAKESARYALGLLAHMKLELPSLNECEKAIESLVQRRFTTIVDTEIQSRIASINGMFDGVGPTDGMPLIGDLDFTLGGADLWRAILNFENSSMGHDYYWFNCGAFIYRRNATILIGYNADWVLHDVKVCEFTPTGPFEEIGPWRNQWWREIPHGYRQRCLPLTE